MACEIFAFAVLFPGAAGFAGLSTFVDWTGLSRNNRLRQHYLVRISCRGASIRGYTVRYRAESDANQWFRRRKRSILSFASRTLADAAFGAASRRMAAPTASG